MTHRRTTTALVCATTVVACGLAFGLASMALGQDANWDLLNYHRYNPWAFLDGRLDRDLAPGGAPSYLNPLLDLPYAWMVERWPGPVTAFVMGAIHGMDIVLVAGLGVLLLPPRRHLRAVAIAIVLALVAATDTTFIAELGNTMGDDTTAVPMLAALLIVVAAARGTSHPQKLRLLAGGLAGAATGLKLTNAPCALGLLAAVGVMQAMAVRDRRATVAAVGATAAGLALGFVASYGFWAVTLWQHFGNPFFPQFGTLFPSPLVANDYVFERRWQPGHVVEWALFPIVFSLFPMRINEMPLVNPLWPIAYVALLAWLARRLRTVLLAPRSRTETTRGDNARTDVDLRYAGLVAFVATGYMAWMIVFSVGRYAVVLQLLLPLLVATTVPRLLARHIARPVVLASLAFAAIFPLLRFDPLARAPFADKPYDVEVPPIAHPEQTTVLVPGGPMGWMLPAFPSALVYAGFETRFPESPAYRDRVRAMIAARGGPVFALLPFDREEGSGRWKLNELLAAIDAHRGDALCWYASTMVALAPASDLVFADDGGRRPAPCRFDRDPVKRGALMHDEGAAVRVLAARGYALDVAACTVHRAHVGAAAVDYRWCPVRTE